MNQEENDHPKDQEQAGGHGWERCRPDALESVLTARLLEQLLPAAPARILECGAGAGPWTLELRQRGYQVTPTDLSQTDLRFPALAEDPEFDAALLLDPACLAGDGSQGQFSLARAADALRPGGRLVTSFALRSPGRIDEALDRLWQAGLEVERVYGLPRRPGGREARADPSGEQSSDDWIEIATPTDSAPRTWEGIECLLVAAIKPAWRNALRRIAQTLNKEKIEYCIVGGASVVLQGVRLPVKDLDLEMSGPDAYRFQQLFASQARLPVAYREDVQYRSHFGVFEIDGVSVDVSGDLERREGESWAPTRVLTRTTVDLEGVPVRVSWLEEELLAYIRRGRLERAAQCLLKCDRDKLLRLLRGGHPVGVI